MTYFSFLETSPICNFVINNYNMFRIAARHGISRDNVRIYDCTAISSPITTKPSPQRAIHLAIDQLAAVHASFS